MSPVSQHAKYFQARWSKVVESQRIQRKNRESKSFRQVAAKFMVEDDEEQMKEELKEAFRIYDKEVTKALKKNFHFELEQFQKYHASHFQCQGFITNDVLKDILREIDSTLTEEDLDHIVEEVDEDGSGTMDFDEFQEMMMG